MQQPLKLQLTPSCLNAFLPKYLATQILSKLKSNLYFLHKCVLPKENFLTSRY